MQNIIENILKNELKNIANIYENNESKSFTNLVEKTQVKMQEIGVKIIEKFAQNFDENYCKTKPKNVLVKNNLKERKILTKIGQINLQRKLYFDKIKKEYFFAFDDFFSIPKNKRIDSGMQKELIQDATYSSFGSASRACNNVVSRQTIFNLSKTIDYDSLANVEKQKVNAKVQTIFVEADEDHIHLQNQKNCKLVKLVYVYEGKKEVCKNRIELVNARYFVTTDNDSDKLWNDVANYVYTKYFGAKIILQGDGAQWIRQGEVFLPTAKFYLDKFHIHKAIITACSGDKSLRNLISYAVREKSKEAIKEGFRLIERKVPGTLAKRNDRLGNLQYLLNNLDVIDLDNTIGCCAESHVSHVLSARMSSRPMAWSEEGAERMAQLRAFLYNKGNFADISFLKLPQISEKKKESERKVHFSDAHTHIYEPIGGKFVDWRGVERTKITKKVF